MASNHTKIGAHFCCCSAGYCGSKGARRKQANPLPKKSINESLYIFMLLYGARRSVGRSGGSVFPVVSSAGWRFCYLHTRTSPPPSRSTANTARHICHHSEGVTSTMYYCCFKKRRRDPIKKQRVNPPSPVWACALDPTPEKRS